MSIFGRSAKVGLALGWGTAFALYPGQAAALSSCGSSGEVGARVSVPHEGSVYYVTTPSNYSAATAYPLIVGLHGDEGDPASSVNGLWRDVAGGAFIFVAPKAPNAGGSWYAAQAENEIWMDGLINTVKSRYNVDLDKISMWGLSGGAVFTSRYILARQHWLAASEMNMGGSGRRYVAPTVAGCEIPARFVVSLTDNLRDGALGFFELLTQNAHETVWVDANCEGHCFDRVEAGVVARDWLLSHTLCGKVSAPGCLGNSGAGGSGAVAGAAGVAGSGSGGASPQGGSGGAIPTGGGATTAGRAAGGSTIAAGGVNGAAGAVTSGAPGSVSGGSAAGGSPSGGTPMTSGGADRASSGGSSSGVAAAAGLAGTSTSVGAIPPLGGEAGSGCSCRTPKTRARGLSWPGVASALVLLAAVRRRRAT